MEDTALNISVNINSLSQKFRKKESFFLTCIYCLLSVNAHPISHLSFCLSVYNTFIFVCLFNTPFLSPYFCHVYQPMSTSCLSISVSQYLLISHSQLYLQPSDTLLNPSLTNVKIPFVTPKYM